MARTSLNTLQPFLQPYARWLVSAAPYAGARSVRITSVWRSRAEQQQLWDNYRAGRSTYPAAPPGSSKHELGLAWDMVTEPYSALSTLGAWWIRIGGEWSSKDPIHFATRG
jgi:hypothetical protein